MADDPIWNPDELEEGFTRPEDSIEEDAAYLITNAEIGIGTWGDKSLLLTLEPDEGDEVKFEIKLSNRTNSKWGIFVNSLRDASIKLTDAGDLIGKKIIAGKKFEDQMLPKRIACSQHERWQNNCGDCKTDNENREKRTIVYFIVKSIVGGADNGSGPAADDPDLIASLVDLCDGKSYGQIITAVTEDAQFAPLKTRVANRSLLTSLIDQRLLSIEGKEYKKVG